MSSSFKASIESVVTAITMARHWREEAVATTALEEKVRDSTICIRPIYDPLATEFKFKEGRVFGIQLMTTLEPNDISTHFAQSGIYSAHTLSKAISKAVKQEIQDDIEQLQHDSSPSHSGSSSTDQPAVDLLEHWTRTLESHLALCGDGAKDITLITEQESKRLLTLKSKKWYLHTEPENSTGAF
jgi:hypothetical protein